MTSKEFILWLKGFTEAIDTPTNAQWDILKDKLMEVKDEQPIGVGGWGVPTTQPFPIWQVWQEPQTIPFISTIPNGTAPPYGFVVTTTPGSSISTTITSNGTTSTTNGYPSGSSWSYTTGTK